MNKKTLLRRVKKSRFFMIGAISLLIIIMACVLAPLYVPYDPEKADIANRLMAPEWFSHGLSGHILGTDALGRDILARLLYGGRASLLISVTVVVGSTIIGIILGLLAGYYSGIVDQVIMRACDIMMATPSLMLAIIIVAVLGSSYINLIWTLIITSWIMGTRILRGSVLAIRESEYVQAAKVMGAGDIWIMMKEILPNVVTPMLISASQQFGAVILTEGSMSFLGMGVPLPAPSWGTMLADGRAYIDTAPWVVVVPGVTLMLVVLAFNFLGDGVRDVLDPKNTD